MLYTELNNKVGSMLEELKRSNSYYTQTKGKEFFEKLTNGQHPKATLLGCSDARVKVRTNDAASEDDVFVVRNIGNQFIVAEGSVAYGIYHLHTPLLLIMGHTRCGAIAAAVSEYRHEKLCIRREINHLALPIRKYAGQELDAKTWLAAVIDNVNFQVEECLREFAPEVESKKLTIVGLIYDIANDMGNGHGTITPINLNGETDMDVLKLEPVLSGFFNAQIKIY